MSASAEVDKGMDLLLLGGLLVGGYFIYKALQKVPQALSDNPLVQGTTSAIASVIEALTFGAPIAVNGNLVDQDGNALGPVSQFPATTYQGDTYLLIQGGVYEMTGSDQNGTYIATFIGPQSASGTGMLPAQSAYTGGTNPGGTGGTGATVLGF